MKKINDSPDHPLKFILEDGTTIGQFYNSIDKTYHLAQYVPYETPPTIYVCGGSGNFSPSRSDDEHMNRCTICFNILHQLS